MVISPKHSSQVLRIILLIIAAAALLGLVMLAPLSNVTQWGIDGNVSTRRFLLGYWGLWAGFPRR
jgi:hypothetical protein